MSGAGPLMQSRKRGAVAELEARLTHAFSNPSLVDSGTWGHGGIRAPHSPLDNYFNAAHADEFSGETRTAQAKRPPSSRQRPLSSHSKNGSPFERQKRPALSVRMEAQFWTRTRRKPR